VLPLPLLDDAAKTGEAASRSKPLLLLLRNVGLATSSADEGEGRAKTNDP
jgi:hypothetical protein